MIEWLKRLLGKTIHRHHWQYAGESWPYDDVMVCVECDTAKCFTPYAVETYSYAALKQANTGRGNWNKVFERLEQAAQP